MIINNLPIYIGLPSFWIIFGTDPEPDWLKAFPNSRNNTIIKTNDLHNIIIFVIVNNILILSSEYIIYSKLPAALPL
jgi:hypothetical protein